MAYIEDLIGYTNNQSIHTFTFDDERSFPALLLEFLDGIGWDTEINGSQYIATSQRCPWFANVNEPPSYYRGKVRVRIWYDEANLVIKMQVSDSVDQMIMDASSIFHPLLSLHVFTNETIIIANLYQFYIFRYNYTSALSAVYVGSIQVPQFLQTYLHLVDAIIGVESDWRTKFIINDNAFVGFNSQVTGVHYWNSNLIDNVGIPSFHLPYDAIYQTPLVYSNESPIAMPPFLSWGDSPIVQAKVKGFPWDTMIIAKPNIVRDTILKIGTKNYWVYSSSNRGSLIIAIS